jgi:arylsulfatase A-like enzyme
VVSNLNEGSSRHLAETYYSWERVDNGVIEAMNRYVTTDQVDDAIDRVHAMREPWLLYLAPSAAHTPLTRPPPELASDNDDVGSGPDDEARLYYQTLEAADTELGRLFAEVDLARTVVFCLGDNGTSDVAVLPPWDPNAAKQTLFEGGINVPFFAAGPGVAVGAESAALVSAVDLLPTVAELAGVDPGALRTPAGDPLPIDGHSLVGLLADPAGPGPELVYSEQLSPLGLEAEVTDERAIRDGRWKYLVSDRSGMERLADLAGRVDDGPDLLQAPLTAEAEDALARLRAAMDDYRRSLVPLPRP